jgi:U3 small nucleolar RNA-associated protein MPP10
MPIRKRKETREFIPTGIVQSDSESDGEEPIEDTIGLDDDDAFGSDDDVGIYSDDDLEEGEEEEDNEDEGDEEDDEGEESEVDEEDGEEGIPEDDEDRDSDFSSGTDGAEEPMMKKPRGLGQLGKKLDEMEKKIKDLESSQIKEKNWTMTGEVFGKNRPMNSLLDEAVELPFGHMAIKRLDESMDLITDENDFDPENPEKPKFDIELIIRQRCIDRTFDDVIKRRIESVSIVAEKPTDRLEGLDFDKSQLGLADVYAKQYEKEIFGQDESKEKTNQLKEEAKRVFSKLMHKLDSLTNFNFAPKPPTIKRMVGASKDVPAMKLEEPIPIIINGSNRVVRK